MNLLTSDPRSRKIIIRRIRKLLVKEDTVTDSSPYSTIVMLATGTGLPCMECLSMDGAPALEKKSAHHTVTCRNSGSFKDLSIIMSCPICFKTIDNQHEPHAMLQMLLVGYGKSCFQEYKFGLAVNLNDVMRNVSATFKIDVYKRSPMTDLTLSQMFALTYRVLVSGPCKVNITRISDYDSFRNFSINNPEWKDALKTKLVSGYNSTHAPDLTEELNEIANAGRK